MSTGRGIEKRTLYFGPAKGFYEPERFERFACNEVTAELKRIHSSSPCNIEPQTNGETVYHFPSAGIGLSYNRIGERCAVNLVATQRNRRELEAITELVFELDAK